MLSIWCLLVMIVGGYFVVGLCYAFIIENVKEKVDFEYRPNWKAIETNTLKWPWVVMANSLGLQCKMLWMATTATKTPDSLTPLNGVFFYD